VPRKTFHAGQKRQASELASCQRLGYSACTPPSGTASLTEVGNQEFNSTVLGEGVELSAGNKGGSGRFLAQLQRRQSYTKCNRKILNNTSISYWMSTI
jgi:hypothetical protein